MEIYTCPICGDQGEVHEEWQVNAVLCSRCGVEKVKKEIGFAGEDAPVVSYPDVNKSDHVDSYSYFPKKIVY